MFGRVLNTPLYWFLILFCTSEWFCKHLFLVRRGFTIFQKFLFEISLTLVVSLNFFVFTSLFIDLYLIFSLDGQLKYLFSVFDLFVTTLLNSLVMKSAWFPLITLSFLCAWSPKILVKIYVCLLYGLLFNF